MRKLCLLFVGSLLLCGCHHGGSPQALATTATGPTAGGGVGPSSSSDVALSLLTLDGRGHLWGARNAPPEVLEMDLKDGQIRRRFPIPQLLAPENLVADGKGDIWVSGTNGQLLEFPVTSRQARAVNLQARGLAVGPSGNVWISDGGWHLYHYMVASGHLRAHAASLAVPIAAGPQGDVWSANDFLETEWLRQSQLRTFRSLGLEHLSSFGAPADVNAIAVDSLDNVWLCNRSADAIMEWPATARSHFILYRGSRYGFSHPTALAFDQQNNLWIGNQAQSYLTEIPRDGKGTPKQVGAGSGIPGLPFGTQALAITPAGDIWVAHLPFGLSMLRHVAAPGVWPRT